MPGKQRLTGLSTTLTCAISSSTRIACSIRRRASNTMPEGVAPDRAGRARRDRLLSRFARDYLLPQWKWFSARAVFAAITAVCAGGYSQITAHATDWLKDGDPRIFTIAPMVIDGARAVAGTGYVPADADEQSRRAERGCGSFRRRCSARLIDGDFARLQSKASGEYVSQFANDMILIRDAALRVATSLAKSSLTIVAAVVYMLMTDWLLTVLLLIVYPIAFIPVVRLAPVFAIPRA